MKPGGALERRLHVASEVNHLEAATAKNAGRTTGCREPNVVAERYELFGDHARSQGMAEPIARGAVQDSHAKWSYVHPWRIFPRVDKRSGTTRLSAL
jgi:hypothetical protein